VQLLLKVGNLFANRGQFALSQDATVIHVHGFRHQVLALLGSLEIQVMGHVMQVLDFGDPRSLLGSLLQPVLDRFQETHQCTFISLKPTDQYARVQESFVSACFFYPPRHPAGSRRTRSL
jgi:hypothetical protein